MNHFRFFVHFLLFFAFATETLILCPHSFPPVIFPTNIPCFLDVGISCFRATIYSLPRPDQAQTRLTAFNLSHTAIEQHSSLESPFVFNFHRAL